MKIQHTTENHTQHPANNPMYNITCKTVCFVKSTLKRKVIEGLIIGREQPILNKQVNCFIAKLFPSVIT